MSRSGHVSIFGIALVGIALAMPAAATSIDSNYPVFEVIVCTQEPSGGWACYGEPYYVTADQGSWIDGTFVWEMEAGEVYEWSRPAKDGGRETVAVLDGGSVEVGNGGLRANEESVSLSFSVLAGSQDTQFMVRSALLSFPTIQDPTGLATGAFTLRNTDDLDGVPATLVGGANEYVGDAYYAAINGHTSDMPMPTAFHTAIDQITHSGFGNKVESFEYPLGGGFTPVGESVSSMSSQIAFTLSADDAATGSTVFAIVPEPAAALMLLAGLMVVRRR